LIINTIGNLILLYFNLDVKKVPKRSNMIMKRIELTRLIKTIKNRRRKKKRRKKRRIKKIKKMSSK
jgi:hypothetical protein